MPKVVSGDFYPGIWSIHSEGGKKQRTDYSRETGNWVTFDGEDYKWVIDRTTGRKYYNQEPGKIRCSFVFSIIGAPLVTVASLINVVSRIVKICSFSHFWIPIENEEEYDWKSRFLSSGEEALRCLGALLIGTWVFIPLSIYGCFSPYDGRKLWATTERVIYGKGMLAPTFQPYPYYEEEDSSPCYDPISATISLISMYC